MEKEKTYTTTEVMEMCGMTRAAVLSRARLFGFTKYCKYVLKKTSWGNYIKEFTFTESQVKAMGCDHEYHEKKVEEVAEKTNEEKLEALKREHPLVTNEKCFTLSWFPETIPSVLQGEEEIENNAAEYFTMTVLEKQRRAYFQKINSLPIDDRGRGGKKK